jgi:hypothetical protein
MRFTDRYQDFHDAPFGFAAGDMNVRRYVGNGATNGVDPTGLEDPKISGDDLRKLVDKDPATSKSYEKLNKEQKDKIIASLMDAKGKNAEFVQKSLSVFNSDEFGKSWLLIGPTDASHPANQGTKRTVGYNCASHVLQRFGATSVKIDGETEDLSSVGVYWPDGIDNVTGVSFDDLPKLLEVWDAFLNAPFDKGRFVRMDWKPDLKTFEGAKSSKLPEFNKDKNYVILMAQWRKGGVIFSHVFTNTEKHEWWVSKAGNGPTILHKSPTAFVTKNEKDTSNYGVILAIWEEVPPKKK